MRANASKRRAILAVASLAALGFSMHAQATSLYWDTNGSAPGAGNPATGSWDTTTPNWNTDLNGADQGVISAYPADGSTTDVVFSASNDAVGTNVITLNGALTANSITFEEGTNQLKGGVAVDGVGPSLSVGAGGMTAILGPATLKAPTFDAALTVIVAADQTWNLTGIGSSFRLDGPVQFDHALTLTRNTSAANANFVFTNSQSTGSSNIIDNGTSNAVTIQVGASSVFDTNGNLISGPLGTGTVKINQGRFESASTTPGNGAGASTFTIGNAMEVTGNTAAFGGQSQVGPLIFTGPVTLDAGNAKTVTLDGPTASKPQFLTFNGPVNLLTNGTFSAAAADTTTIAGPITDDFATTAVGKNLTKTGGGTIILTGTNTFHGAFSVLNGTVMLQSTDLTNSVANASAIRVVTPGSLDVTGLPSGLTVGNQTLSGSGTITGNVTLAGGGTFSFDNSGSLNVNGNLALTDGGTTNVVLPTLASLTAGTYAMIGYTGTHTGIGTFAVSVPPNTRANPTVDATAANVVNLVINGNAADLVWKGDGAGNAWNVNQTPNWSNGGNSDNFFNLDRVTFDDTSTNTTVNVTDTVFIGGMTVNGAQSYTFQGAGSITGTGSLVINTTGQVTMSTSNSYTGGTNVNAGTLLVTNADALSSGTGISVAGGASIVLAPNLSHAIKAFPVQFNGGLVDLANNKLLDDYVSNSQVGTITSAIQNAYNGGAWTGTSGLTSSAAAAVAADTNNPHKTGIGFAEASALPGVTTFGGVPTDSTMVLVRYTYFGDANLDGTVNALDFNALASNFGAGGKSWVNGDFDYSGTVDTADFTMLSQNFGLSLGAAPALGSVVPEPTMLGLIAMSGFAMLARKRKQGE